MSEEQGNPHLTDRAHEGFCTVEIWDDGHGFKREVVHVSDSVNGLLVDLTRGEVILIRQEHLSQRRKENPTGTETETVAGRFDVDLGPKALLVKEALEECGTTITEEDVQLLNGGHSMSLSAGILTERAFLSVVFVEDDQVTGPETGLGDKDEGERIDRVRMPISQFIDPNTVHQGIRTFAFAQWLRATILFQMMDERISGKLTDDTRDYYLSWILGNMTP